MTHYIVVSENEIVKAEMERPNKAIAKRVWQKYIYSLPRIAIEGKHKWKLWEKVILGKDFRFQHQSLEEWGWCNCSTRMYKDLDDDERRIIAIPIQPTPEGKTERFKRPTDQQIVNAAILFNDGKVEKKKLSDMVALCDFVIDRLYENGDMTIPSSKEYK